MLSSQDRNFRSYYYEKVGFRGVDEKKSLEKLINGKPIDKQKLSKFCSMFSLPSMYREHVWKVLLDVVSVNPDSHESILREREQGYKELKYALEITRKVNCETPKHVLHTLMYLLAEEQLQFNLEEQMQENHALLALASSFVGISSTDVSSFWLFRNFVLYQKKFEKYSNSLKEQFETLLKKEDPELHSHLVRIDAMKVLPTETWFKQYFAEVLHVCAFERTLDKVIGGSCRILPYVGVFLLVALRRDLLSKNKADVLKYLIKVPEDTSDIVVSKAIEMSHGT